MAYKEVIFLNKKYEISDQLPIFVQILNDFSGYSDTLMDLLVRQMNRRGYNSGSQEDFGYWRIPIDQIAKEIILKASSVNVYNLTVYDLVDDNDAFQQLYQCCVECFQNMKNILINAMDEWIHGYESAYNRAASTITGPGFGVITNSIAGAVLYDVVAYNSVRTQAKQADYEFQTAISRLNSYNSNRQRAEEDKVLTNYYSSVKNLIPSIITYMFDVYSKKLADSGILDISELKTYDLKSSNDILRNLDIVESKKDVLYKAFEKCPYNPDVFLRAAYYGLMDQDTFDTAVYLQQEEGLDQAVLDFCRSAFPKDCTRTMQAIEVLSYIKNASKETIAQKEFTYYVNAAVASYAQLRKASEKKDVLVQWLKNNLISDIDALLDADKDAWIEAMRDTIHSILPQDQYKFYLSMNMISPSKIIPANDIIEDMEDIHGINELYCVKMESTIGILIDELKGKRDNYLAALAKYQAEKRELELKRASLEEKMRSLSIFQRSAKKEVNKQISIIASDINQLESKYKVRPLEYMYKRPLGWDY